ncbi:DUF1499 domain-containing protein [Pikeienuella piscinae]|uniref:DUF1499 domain-containing protein n=1 Tax=Pikeienuella piscinae TaxID=2748098 RepID=A0A7L5BUY9_9RHOB|nr:DUF1499 domain-containing protein [Pikeienuella piscinae]QIE54873.1 DUF1499 domain-containing protein [Pikeienuella piscinae]
MSRIARALLWIIATICVAFIAFAIWVRLAPDDAADWREDPAAITASGALNEYVVRPEADGADAVSPVYDEPPESLIARFRDMALAEPRVGLLDESGGILTLVQRSMLMGFPDYISVRAVSVDGGAALYIHSRSRYGKSDWGVNEARISAWLGNL